ncbi:hypothetical protein AB0K15_47155 [Amycolatopsis sp. NPDC049253]|uniref:hypothetical protein n=1 Tax=Amycolatopsis sp. NPDC049253 TaxID=3155274 RepID=UPI003419482B
MSDYLAKAAELIAAAADNNERKSGPGSSFPVAETYQERALRCADAYAALAAIERGQVPTRLIEGLLESIRGDRSVGGWS